MPQSDSRSGKVTPLRPRHISETMARDFYEGKLEPDKKALVVRHLLGRCARCSDTMLRAGLEVGALAPSQAASIRALATSCPEIGERRVLGIAQWAILESRATDRDAYIEQHPEFHHLGLYESLLEEAKLELRQDPRKAVEAAELALTVARRLQLADELRLDYLAVASATLGNALRCSGDYAGAERAFRAAWGFAEDGTADPLVGAQIFRYEGSLHDELGRYEHAEEAYRRALAEYVRAGDQHLQGRTLLSMSAAAIDYDLKKALSYVARANALFDASIEPFLEWCARHNEIWILNDMGRPKEALALLESSREIYHHFGVADPWVRLRMYWIEGRIAFNLGRIKEAEVIFTMLFRLLDQEGKHPRELTRVAVDLLHAISAQDGRARDIMKFAEMLLPLLRDLGLHEQGLAIVAMLRDRLLQGAIDAAAWKAVATYMRRNWHQPVAAEVPLLG
jgi:tetratricopeptide (TPR) repeat protein